jgi:hypothetical protein
VHRPAIGDARAEIFAVFARHSPRS